MAAAIALSACAFAGTFASPSTAQAAEYRYWSYWLGADSAWSFAPLGPAFRVPKDGTVDGWRFAVNGVAGNTMPSMAPDFDAVCGQTPAQEGSKRVALIVDPGSAGDAPDGETPPGPWAMCVVAPAGATGMDVLRAAADVRLRQGFVCSVAGYPATDCALDAVAPSPTPTAKPAPTPSPKPSATKKPLPRPSETPSQRPSKTPKPTTAPPASATPSPSQSSAPSAPKDERRGSGQSSATAVPATQTPTTPSAQPSPTYSLLTSPLAATAQEPSPSNATLSIAAAVAALVAAAALGGAAVLRTRRQR